MYLQPVPQAIQPSLQQALNALCSELGCDKRFLVSRAGIKVKQWSQRDNNKAAQAPAAFIGRVTLGDMVIKSGKDWDRIAEKEGIIAFEMEGAGIWEPYLVIEGIGDYADCHKDKKWEDFAAAIAEKTGRQLTRQSEVGQRQNTG
jgi:nucleoside phosphorylase